MKKMLLSIGVLAGALAPIAMVVSCGKNNPKDTKVEKDEVNIGYWPDIDPAMALGLKIRSSAQSSDHFATWFPKESKWAKQLETISTNKPLWDSDTMDEEYWRNLNGEKSNVNLVHEAWIKTPQKSFLKSDPKINPIEFDYNAGIPHEQYHWIVGNGQNQNEEILIQNQGDTNYQNMGDLYQIRDMGEILKVAANAADNLLNTDQYIKKAQKVINTTNEHWADLRKLQEQHGGDTHPYTAFTTEQLSNRDINLSSAVNDNASTGVKTTDETILVINIETGAVSAGSNDTMALATPSVAKELYTKTHFSMPSLMEQQFTTLKQQNNLRDNGNAIEAGATNNGIYFPNWKQTPLPPEFWSDFNNKVDKLVVGVDYKELQSGIISLDTLNQETDAGSTGATLRKMVGGSLTPQNTVLIDSYLAGSGSYGYRMPIGQNAFIDTISRSFYGESNFNWQDKF